MSPRTHTQPKRYSKCKPASTKLNYVSHLSWTLRHEPLVERVRQRLCLVSLKMERLMSLVRVRNFSIEFELLFVRILIIVCIRRSLNILRRSYSIGCIYARCHHFPALELCFERTSAAEFYLRFWRGHSGWSCKVSLDRWFTRSLPILISFTVPGSVLLLLLSFWGKLHLLER